MDDRAEIFEFLSEVDKACDRPIDIEDIETRSIRNRVFNPWRREVHCLGLGQDAPIADVHEQAELAKMIEEITGAGDKVRSSVEEKSTIVSEERKPELKGCCTTLALHFSPMVTPSVRVRNSGLGTGQFIVSIAACMMNRNSTGPSQEPCRTPIELSSSESTDPTLTLILRFREVG